MGEQEQVAQDTAHATQPRDTTQQPGTRMNRSQVAQGPHTQHNAPSEHTGEKKPGGPVKQARNTTHRANRAVNRSQVAQDTAHARQRTEQAHR